jgi:hypothetical protein
MVAMDLGAPATIFPNVESRPGSFASRRVQGALDELAGVEEVRDRTRRALHQAADLRAEALRPRHLRVQVVVVAGGHEDDPQPEVLQVRHDPGQRRLLHLGGAGAVVDVQGHAVVVAGVGGVDVVDGPEPVRAFPHV